MLNPDDMGKSQAWRYYYHFYYGLRSRLTLVSLLSLVQTTLLLPIALMIRYAFDHLLPQRDFRGLVEMGMGMLTLYLVTNALMLFTRHQILSITKIAVQRFRDELLHKVFTLSRSYYTQADRQQLHTGIVQDTERLDVMTNAFLTLFLPSALMGAALSGILAYLNWRLFLLLMILVPLLYAAGRILGKKFRSHVRVFHQKFENFSKGMSFILRMLDLTQLQTAESLELARQRKSHDELRESSRDMAWLGTAYTLTQNMIVVSTSVLILIFGGRAVIQGKITLGDLLAFYFAFGLLRDQMRSVYQAVPEIIAGGESLQTLHKIIGIQDPLPYQGTKKFAFRGEIRMEGVDFRYRDAAVLKNIDLCVQPGMTFALIGPNGSGKSTLLNLVLGFYRPNRGRILADGQPYESLDMTELRRQIGILLQDPMLFPGTIRENLTYGVENVDEQRLRWAAELATAHAFICDLPRGYDSPIGESGVLLSGGQCQRIALARALLRRPALLILDEPTNHLDPVVVQEIQDNLKKEMSSISTLIVSHDERMIRQADRIYLLENGSLIDGGDPVTLRQNPIYQRLFPRKAAEA